MFKKMTFGAVVAGVLLVATPVWAGKYDGQWTFSVKTTKGSGCSARPGIVTVEDGKISGSLKSEGKTFKVKGKIKEDGKFRGRVMGVSSYKGEFKGNQGKGTWKNRYGCAGTVSIRK